MINELSKGGKISFMGRKETDLERKVRKLEQDMLQLDDILNKEKLVRKKPIEYKKEYVCSPAMQSHYRLFQDLSTHMAQGDGPDPWQVMPIHIHRNSTSSQVQPSFFFTWDCTPYDFHNNNAQRSIYTLLDQWRPGGNSISADQFKKQLSALLIANKKSASTTDLAVNHLGDISSKENLALYTIKSETGVKKPDFDTKTSDLDSKKSEPDAKNPELETREILANLEKKLKEVESKCRDDCVSVSNPFTIHKTKTDNKFDVTEKIDEDSDFIDDLIFEIFEDSREEFEKKPIELEKEVDDLQNLMKSYSQVGDLMFQKCDSNK